MYLWYIHVYNVHVYTCIHTCIYNDVCTLYMHIHVYCTCLLLSFFLLISHLKTCINVQPAHVYKCTCTIYSLHYCKQGGDLRSVINECREGRSHVEEREVWKVLSQLLQALHECHKKRHGVHRVRIRSLFPVSAQDDQVYSSTQQLSLGSR